MKRFEKPILVTRAYLSDLGEFKTSVDEIWRNQWLTNNGPMLKKFRVKLSEYNLYVRHYVGKCYTNRRTSYTSEPPAMEKYVLLQYTNCEPYVSLKDILFYRLAFYRHKFNVISRAMSDGAKKAKGMESLGREWRLYPLLMNAHVSTNASDRTLCVLQSEGVHIPIHKNGSGEDLPLPSDSRNAIREYFPYILSYVADFLDVLKKKGVYDNSLIIVAADHGILYDPKSAMLWVKPFGDMQSFESDDTPTSHSRIAQLLKASVDNNLSRREVLSILTQKNRKIRIRQVSKEKWWQRGAAIDTYDIIYGDDGQEVSRTNLGAFLIN